MAQHHSYSEIEGKDMAILTNELHPAMLQIWAAILGISPSTPTVAISMRQP
jgi:hypothetical protein